MTATEQVDTVVVGGGQAGLALGYYLAQQQRDFVILDAHERIGDAWRTRWDSLRLFTPARFDGLPGAAFPADPLSFPTKDQLPLRCCSCTPATIGTLISCSREMSWWSASGTPVRRSRWR